MKTSTIRKRHDLFIHGSQVKYILVAVIAVVVMIALIALIAFLFNGIYNL